MNISFINTSLNDIQINKDTTIPIPQKPSLDGFIFYDWYKDEEFSEKFDFKEKVTTDTNVYALFLINYDKALEIGNELEHNQLSTQNYCIRGKIKKINNSKYGQMVITDGVNDFAVYGVYGQEEELYEELVNKPVINDIVILKGLLKKYNEDVEFNRTILISFEKGEIPDNNLDDYEKLSISKAYEKPVGSKVLIEGLVASITKQARNTPNGLMLVDDTGAIYVYSNDIAVSVEVGNRIKVAATRTNFILAS